MKPVKKLFLIDAFALIYRSYFAFSKNPRINSKGVETSAVLGFVNSLVEECKRMNIPPQIATAILAKSFALKKNNIYTNTRAYVRGIRNFENDDGMKFYNCSVLLDVMSTNYIVFRIMRYNTTTEKLTDITRMIFPGAYQFVPIHNITIALTILGELPFRAVDEYGV